MKPARLIVNADDLGFEPQRDDAITELFAAGAVTSASLAVNGASARTAALRACEAVLPLGLHLNLGDGPALAGASPIAPDGLFLGKAGSRAALDQAEAVGGNDGVAMRQALRVEIRAQFERFFAWAGRWPTHVDGHHHIHVHPLVAAELAPLLAREFGVYRVRLPKSDEDLAAAFGHDPAALGFHRRVQSECDAARTVFEAHGLRFPSAFFGLALMGGRMSPAALLAGLAEAGKACRGSATAAPSIELMCHPGNAVLPGAPAGDPRHFARDFGASPDRVCERDALAATFGGTAWPEGFERAAYVDLHRPAPPASTVRTLIHSKLSPASGNRTTAERLGLHLATRGEVLHRPLPPPEGRAAEATALRAMVREEGIDLVVGIHCGRSGKPLQEAFAVPGDPAATPIPIVLVASGTDLNVDFAGGDPMRRADVCDGLAAAAGVLALSDELATRIDSAGVVGASIPRATLLQAPQVDTVSTRSLRPSLGLPPDTPIALLPAGIRPVKGIAFAIEAGAQALLDHPAWALVIAGPPLDPDYHAHCASLVREWSLRHRSLKGRLRLIDGLERDDYLAALHEAALLINTSESEGMSNAVLEALAAGVPVLVRDIPGNRAAIGPDESCGLAFSGLPGFVRQFGRLATDAALRARLADAGRRRYETLCDPAVERSVLLDRVDRVLARRLPEVALPSGRQIRLCLAGHTHPASGDNQQLFARFPVPPPGAHRPLNMLDLGCGSGLFGWVVADRLATAGHRFAQVDFADNEPDTVAGLRHALRRDEGSWAARADRIDCFVGDLFSALPLERRGRYDLVLANLPQTPAPQAIANDRHGGADLLCRFLAELPGWLAPGGQACCTHIGLADPARVEAAIAASGLVAEVAAEQGRRVPAAEYDALLPGLAAWLAGETAAGRCRMVVEPSADGPHFRFSVRLLVLRRAGE